MEFWMGVIAATMLCSVISYFKKPKAVGSLIMHDDSSVYLELDDDEAMIEMYANEYVVFRVMHKSSLN